MSYFLIVNDKVRALALAYGFLILCTFLFLTKPVIRVDPDFEGGQPNSGGTPSAPGSRGGPHGAPGTEEEVAVWQLSGRVLTCDRMLVGNSRCCNVQTDTQVAGISPSIQQILMKHLLGSSP